VDGWNGDTVPIGDRFYKGGHTFPGFQTAGIGPRDLRFQDALGGKLYAIGEAQLSVPNYLPEQYGIKTALISDVGTLGLLDRADKFNAVTNQPLTTVRDDLSPRVSVGIRVQWKSPMGPLEFDIAEPVVKQKYDKGEVFQFETSTRF
jgi:outer membrane protein insertion porin family